MPPTVSRVICDHCACSSCSLWRVLVVSACKHICVQIVLTNQYWHSPMVWELPQELQPYPHTGAAAFCLRRCSGCTRARSTCGRGTAAGAAARPRSCLAASRRQARMWRSMCGALCFYCVHCGGGAGVASDVVDVVSPRCVRCVGNRRLLAPPQSHMDQPTRPDPSPPAGLHHVGRVL